MIFSDNFIPAIKTAFGGVDYIQFSDHFKQRWDERKADMQEDAFCLIIANYLKDNILVGDRYRFTIQDEQTRTKIVCEQRPFRLPDDKTGKLINMVTIMNTN